MLKFKVGRFYMHEGGRQIAVLSEVASYRWGPMLVIEEADASGHAISCAEISPADVEAQGWTEIGRNEWLVNFKESSCGACGAVFSKGDKFVATDQGPIHVQCYAKLIEERGPEYIEPVSIH